MYSDNALGKILKNWSAQYRPPANSRSRLLSKAAYTPRRRFNLSALIPRTQYNDYPIHTTNANEWTPMQLTWFFEQSFNAGFQARV
jgi:hypothetical protein